MSDREKMQELIAIRTALGFTQSRMAHEIDMSLRDYQAFEWGEAEIPDHLSQSHRADRDALCGPPSGPDAGAALHACGGHSIRKNGRGRLLNEQKLPHALQTSERHRGRIDDPGRSDAAPRNRAAAISPAAMRWDRFGMTIRTSQ